MFDTYLQRWQLIAAGEPITTHSSRLLPVRHRGAPAMLKIALEPEERFGGVLMEWWQGQGAARVWEREADALLIERAEGTKSLIEMSHGNRDDEATTIICQVTARLHAPRSHPLPDLVPLQQWFRELEPAAARSGGILHQCAAAARELLAEPQEILPLHGDIHHGNILDFGPRGWLAIDPKRLIGERAFDYANLFCNPDLSDPTRPVAALHFARRLEIVCAEASLDRRRLLRWILAWCGLSAAWYLSDGTHPAAAFAIAELAATELSIQ